MRQLDVVVSPPAFVWDPYLILTNVTFDPDPCDLYGSDSYQSEFKFVTDRQMQSCIGAHIVQFAPVG